MDYNIMEQEYLDATLARVAALLKFWLFNP
jgi:hypothetical protein